jgi:hypothetical protein
VSQVNVVDWPAAEIFSVLTVGGQKPLPDIINVTMYRVPIDVAKARCSIPPTV